MRIKGSLGTDKPAVGDRMKPSFVSSFYSPNKFEILSELGEKSESDSKTRITHRGGLSHEASVMVGRINHPDGDGKDKIVVVGSDTQPSSQISSAPSTNSSHQLKGLQDKGRKVCLWPSCVMPVVCSTHAVVESDCGIDILSKG